MPILNEIAVGTRSGSGARLDSPRRLALPQRQLVLLLLLLLVGGGFLAITLQEAVPNTVALLCVVAVSGLFLCRVIRTRLGDPALNVLGYFWLIKLAATLFLLYAGWIPELDPASLHWGYDPQRYYLQAYELTENGWLPELLALNYVGILYYYGVIFFALGHNPVIPALINALVTLLGCLLLIETGYEVGGRGRYKWTICLVLLLPEVLWFDVLTSRETLLGALLILSLLQTGRYLARTASLSLFQVLPVVGIAVLGIAAVRTSMLLPVIASIGLMTLLIRQAGGMRLAQKTLLIGAAVAVLVVGPIVTTLLGATSFDLLDLFHSATSATDNGALNGEIDWSENSIGALLMPNGVVQSILFLVPRMVLYLVAPLPNIAFSVGDLVAGSWVAWQSLFCLLSSALNLVLFPFALASLIYTVRGRAADTRPFIFHIPYWLTFMAVAGGNLIIQERYRVMVSGLLFGCAWLGAQRCPRTLIIKAAITWFSLLVCGSTFYFGYKFVLT